jgi:hypothetical protein
MVGRSDVLADWRVDLGDTTGFFAAGGNIVHAPENVRHRFAMRPTVRPGPVAPGVAKNFRE